jgi:hypothetical protein
MVEGVSLVESSPFALRKQRYFREAKGDKCGGRRRIAF